MMIVKIAQTNSTSDRITHPRWSLLIYINTKFWIELKKMAI